VNVQSESSSVVEESGKRKDELRISSRSDIPLIAVYINTVQHGNEYKCEVNLESNKNLALYSKKPDELLLEIVVLDQRISKAKENDKYALLSQALTVIEQYDKYRAVSQLLGETQFNTPVRNCSDTEAQLRALEKAAPSIELAAQVLAKGLKEEAVYWIKKSNYI
jgi:hypothetical protein